MIGSVDILQSGIAPHRSWEPCEGHLGDDGGTDEASRESGEEGSSVHFGKTPQFAALALPALMGTSSSTQCSKCHVTSAARSSATSSRHSNNSSSWMSTIGCATSNMF